MSKFNGVDYYNIDSLLSEEEKMIRDSVREFISDEVIPIIEEYATKGKFPVDLIPKMAELGLLGPTLPAKYGCAEMNNVAYGLVMQELERGDSSIRSFASVMSGLVMYPIFTFGSEEQKDYWLPLLAKGDKIGCFGLTEPDYGSNPGGMVTKAEKVDGGFLLNGAKMWITNGTIADIAVVWAKLDNVVNGFLVEKGTPGWNVNRIVDKLGLLTVNLTCMEFNNCHVNQDQVLGTVGSGLKMALAMLDRGRLGIAAQAIGIAEAAFEASVQHAKTREQFGKPIGENEAIAFKLADMKVKLEASKLLLFKAVRLRDQKKPFSEEAAMAKLYASEAANEIAAEAVQIHGGYGYIKDYPIERYYRDARITTIYEGTSEIQRLVISRHILK